MDNQIEKMVNEFISRKKAALDATLSMYAGHMEGYAKEHAPWKPRFGHAEQGIHAGVEKDGNTRVLYLSHGVRYGEYLEKGTGIYGPHKKPIKPVTKKYLSGPGLPHPVKEVKGMEPRAIIKPTVDKYIESLKRDIKKVFED